MSFLGIRKADGERVLPEEVDDGVDVECPSCGEELRPRGPYSDGRARHFFHLADTDCPGGESETHRKQKSLAASALRSELDDYQRCGLEVSLDVSDTQTGVERRQADVLLEFETEHRIFGHGIIIEVQYRNRNKNIPATTYDYLTQDFSVIWADQEAFTDKRFRLDEIILDFEESEQTYRPDATSPNDLLPLAPPDLTGTKCYFDERVDGPETPTMRSEDECEHRWVEEREYCYQCPDCDAKLVANPSRKTDSTSTEEQELGGPLIVEEVGFVISLDESVSFDSLSDFQPRGKLVKIHGEDRACSNCETKYKHTVGWDGVNTYGPGSLKPHISGKSYASLCEVNGSWKRCCPNCGKICEYRFTELADLFYTSPQIDTIWIPHESQSRRARTF